MSRATLPQTKTKPASSIRTFQICPFMPTSPLGFSTRRYAPSSSGPSIANSNPVAHWLGKPFHTALIHPLLFCPPCDLLILLFCFSVYFVHRNVCLCSSSPFPSFESPASFCFMCPTKASQLSLFSAIVISFSSTTSR